MNTLGITVNRIYLGETYTIGKMYYKGLYLCDTLEDTVRDLPKEQKIWGKTAIPKGSYECCIVYWYKIKRNVIAINNVPYFSGILIHGGATEIQTHGCILVGYNTIPGRLTDSKKALDLLMNKIDQDKPDKITICIK